MKSDKEIREQVRAIREKVRGFSGYWVGEAAAAIGALEWVTGKRPTAPSQDIGSPGGEHEKIAAGLLKLAEEKKKPGPEAKPGPEMGNRKSGIERGRKQAPKQLRPSRTKQRKK